MYNSKNDKNALLLEKTLKSNKDILEVQEITHSYEKFLKTHIILPTGRKDDDGRDLFYIIEPKKIRK